ncbi:hypothetical protein LSAJ18_230099 [Latilactobacillus sakei]|nr:hypothetical protein LSAJ18_230099 [Latilactobacillus sakei]
MLKFHLNRMLKETIAACKKGIDNVVFHLNRMLKETIALFIQDSTLD